MAKTNEIAVMLPADVVASARSLANDRSSTLSELVQEALHRYRESERLMTAIASGADREEALEEFLNEYVVRSVHEARASLRAEATEANKGERVTS